MGWNSGYTVFEATVVGAYDLGKLDKALLALSIQRSSAACTAAIS